MISIRNLEKSFGTHKVLQGINLDIRPGQMTAILGPNGSGKTTLMKAILGMVIPEQGEIAVSGEIINNLWAYRSEINYMPQIARFPENLKVRELIAMIKDLRSEETDEKWLVTELGLDPFWNERLRNLSGGTRQKVNVLLSFMYDKPLTIMDEPTAGLDPVALLKLKKLISNNLSKGNTILFTTHILNLVDEMADEIVFLLEGRIYFHGPKEEMKGMDATGNLEKAIAGILENPVDV